MPTHPRTVFICRDPITGPILDRVQLELEQRGIEVIRGPSPTPGVKLVYPTQLHRDLFARAEVMMFSGGSVGSRAVMQAAPRLRGIVNPAIGVDTVDLAAADELGIIVGHGATEENYIGMAEATVMLILVLSYQLQRTEQVLRENQPRPAPDQAWAHLLRGRTVGLVGPGRIARAVAERLHAFQVEVLACHPRLSAAEAPAGVRLVDLDTLLRESDFVTVHATLSPESHNLIGEREFGLMKPSAYLINTARGGLVDEAALIRALQMKRIAGAALDTFAVEPLPMDSPLRKQDNVVLTPHMVGHTRDAFDTFVSTAVQNITRILEGQPPVHCKNPHTLARWRERLAALAQP
jgi:phosphoglycerate dehydrogenase-like enzyme